MLFSDLLKYMDTSFIVLLCLMVFIFGLVMGSFLNCYAVRICHDEPISKGRSHCMSCGHVLGVKDLVPLFSYLSFKGKCRYCGVQLSKIYPISELSTAIVYLSILLTFGLTWKSLEMFLLATLVLAIAFADIEDYLVPDRFIIAGIIVRCLYISLYFIFGYGWDVAKYEVIQSLIGAFSISLLLFVVTIVMEKATGKEMMGGGDLKLFFMIGLYFDWQINLLTLLIACVLGIIGGLRLNKKGVSLIPWGPFIGIAAWLTMLFGDLLITWYVGLF